MENFYVDVKKANPRFPILVRECSGIQPKLYARYGKLSSLIFKSQAGFPLKRVSMS